MISAVTYRPALSIAAARSEIMRLPACWLGIQWEPCHM
jgi:hypothetical protein